MYKLIDLWFRMLVKPSHAVTANISQMKRCKSTTINETKEMRLHHFNEDAIILQGLSPM